MSVNTFLAWGGHRTCDPAGVNSVLYQLSFMGVNVSFNVFYITPFFSASCSVRLHWSLCDPMPFPAILFSMYSIISYSITTIQQTWPRSQWGGEETRGREHIRPVLPGWNRLLAEKVLGPTDNNIKKKKHRQNKHNSIFV